MKSIEYNLFHGPICVSSKVVKIIKNNALDNLWASSINVIVWEH